MYYLSEGSLPGISTKRSWSQTICKKVSLQSWRNDWQAPENLSMYKETWKFEVNKLNFFKKRIKDKIEILNYAVLEFISFKWMTIKILQKTGKKHWCKY